MKSPDSLIERWQAHLQRLEQSRRHPSAQKKHWRWELEAKVLRFLVARYSAQALTLVALPPARQTFIAPIVFLPPNASPPTQRERKRHLQRIRRENEAVRRTPTKPGLFPPLFSSQLEPSPSREQKRIGRALAEEFARQRQEKARERRYRERSQRRW